MKKNLYTIYSCPQWMKGPYRKWTSFPSATGISMQFAKGFVAGIKQSYPCDNLRIVDYFTNEMIEEIKGNSEVKAK